MEWEPTFKAGEYKPGEYQMPSPQGQGVAKREPGDSGLPQMDTDYGEHGDPFGGDFHDTAAMCDVDDDGVEHKPQGSHESTQGKPNDGHLKKVGHDWPAEPKNSGSGVAEPFEGTRWSDGGTLKGTAPSEFQPGGPTSMPSDGPITGTTGPQMGQPANEWSIGNIGHSISDGHDRLQGLFNEYAQTRDAVCVEDFQDLCDAAGIDISISENVLLNLMDRNQQYMFHEQADGDGVYWLAEDVTGTDAVDGATTKDGWEKPWLKDKKKKKDGKKVEESRREVGSRRPFSSITEALGQPDPLAPPAAGPRPGMGGDPMGGDPMGGMSGATPVEDEPLPSLRDTPEDEFAASHGPTLECSGCGTPGSTESCPECGGEMVEMGSQGRSPVTTPASQSQWDKRYGVSGTSEVPDGPGGPGQGGMQKPSIGGIGESRVVEITPDSASSIKAFLESASSIVSVAGRTNKRYVAEALSHAWSYHAGTVDPRTVPFEARGVLRRLCEKFPTFEMVSEGAEVMERPTGTKIGGGEGPKSTDLLADQPGPQDITQRGGEEYFSIPQKNTLEGTPTIKGTAKGMNESRTLPDSVNRNLARLSRYIKGQFQENGLMESIASKKVAPSYCLAVKTNGKVGKTPERSSFSEAVADAEELLQVYDADDVSLQASFANQTGVVTMRNDIPLLTIDSRAPIMAEGRAVFRFGMTAEAVAKELVAEGISCRIVPHSWGSAVAAKASPKMFAEAFARIQR
jgi:hypothetical protein